MPDRPLFATGNTERMRVGRAYPDVVPSWKAAELALRAATENTENTEGSLRLG